MIRIAHPLRFFSFFGLFLVFIFLGYKSCQENKKNMDFVDGKVISEEVAQESQKDSNTKELSDFIQEVKDEIKKEEKDHHKELQVKKVEKLEDQEATEKAKPSLAKKLPPKVEVVEEPPKPEPKPQLVVEKKPEPAPAVKKIEPPKKKVALKPKKASAPSTSETVRVFSTGSSLSATSKALLKQTYLKHKDAKKIMIYGYYTAAEGKVKGFQRAAEIKSALISVASSLPPIYVLPKESRTRGLTGEVKFD